MYLCLKSPEETFLILKVISFGQNVLDTETAYNTWDHLAESVSCLWPFQDRLGATLLGRAEDRHPLDDKGSFFTLLQNITI